MSASTVTDMNLGGAQPSVNGARRKSKVSELTRKKYRQPRRGMGVEQLEQIIKAQEGLNEMSEVPFPAFNPSSGFTTSSGTAVQNVAVHFRPAPTPAMFFQGIGIHGPNLYSTDHVMDPAVIGSSNAGFRFEKSKELSSIPNYMKCASDGCCVCYKKKRITGGSNHCSVNPFRSFCGNNAVVEMIDAGKTRRRSGQVTEVMSVHRNGGSSLTEYEFFPGKVGGAEEYKEMLRMGSTATCRCGSGTSVAGGIGLRGGDGSCVTAVTGSEEGSVSSLDLSLKLSY